MRYIIRLFVPSVLALNLLVAAVAPVYAQGNGATSGATSAEQQKKESELKALINRWPKSEKAHLDYAIFLYQAERFAEAQKEVDEVLAINATSLPGGLLKEHLVEMRSIKDRQVLTEKRRDFVQKLLAALVERDKTFGSRARVPAPDPNSALRLERRKYLEETYQISGHPNQSEYTLDKFERALLIGQLTQQGIKDEAEKLHLDQVRTYPKDSKVRISYIEFLLKQRRLRDALKQLNIGLASAPNYPEFLRVKDGLKEIAAAAAGEPREAALRTLQSDLQEMQIIRLDALQGKPLAAPIAPPA